MTPPGSVTRVRVRRFRDNAALTFYVTDACGEEHTQDTVYLPQGMLLVLADALQIMRRDIANKNYTDSTFSPRTVLENDVRFD